MKKNQGEGIGRAGGWWTWRCWREVAILSRIFSLTKKVIFDHRFRGETKGIHHVSICGKSIPSRKGIQWKGRIMPTVFKEQHEGQHDWSVVNKVTWLGCSRMWGKNSKGARLQRILKFSVSRQAISEGHGEPLENLEERLLLHLAELTYNVILCIVCRVILGW